MCSVVNSSYIFNFCHLLWFSGFVFSDSEASALEQFEGGPCAVIAPVQVTQTTSPISLRTVFRHGLADFCLWCLHSIITTHTQLRLHCHSCNGNTYPEQKMNSEKGWLHDSSKLTSFSKYIIDTCWFLEIWGFLWFFWGFLWFSTVYTGSLPRSYCAFFICSVLSVKMIFPTRQRWVPIFRSKT